MNDQLPVYVFLGATPRATEAHVELDGGAVLLHVYERRSGDHDLGTLAPQALFEVARISLTPVALIAICDALVKGAENFQRIWGPLPNLAEIAARYHAATTADQIGGELEDRSRQQRPDPPHNSA